MQNSVDSVLGVSNLPMREIDVGLRIDPKEGLSFFGTDEVNELIRQGGRVVAVKPGNAMMRKLGEDEQNVRLTLQGFSVKVSVEEPLMHVK